MKFNLSNFKDIFSRNSIFLFLHFITYSSFFKVFFRNNIVCKFYFQFAKTTFLATSFCYLNTFTVLKYIVLKYYLLKYIRTQKFTFRLYLFAVDFHNSHMVQWSGQLALTQQARVRFPVWENAFLVILKWVLFIVLKDYTHPTYIKI